MVPPYLGQCLFGLGKHPLTRTHPSGVCLHSRLSDYTRLTSTSATECVLETGIVSLLAPAPSWRVWDTRPTRVDVVAAVHVADGDYYLRLQQLLGSYDRVLYEMVADKSKTPRGQRWRPPSGPRRSSKGVVGAIQRWTAALLHLSFQLEVMDYSPQNWHHADLDLERFQQLQKQRGESLWTLGIRLWTASVRKMWGGSDDANATRRQRLRVIQSLLPIPLVAHLVLHGAVSASEEQPLSRSPVIQALLNLDIASGLKLLLARAMVDADNSGLAAPDAQDSVILGDRNAAAIEAVEDALASGARSVAIFYGAAHCPDLETRLQAMGMRRADQQWLSAWRVPLPSSLSAQKPELTKTQAAALAGLSAMLASDLYLWETVFRWVSGHVHI